MCLFIISIYQLSWKCLCPNWLPGSYCLPVFLDDSELRGRISQLLNAAIRPGKDVLWGRNGSSLLYTLYTLISLWVPLGGHLCYSVKLSWAWSALNMELLTGLNASSGGWLNRTEALAAAHGSRTTRMERFYSVGDCLCGAAIMGKYVVVFGIIWGLAAARVQPEKSFSWGETGCCMWKKG